jgi:hypothetical protein
LAYVRLCTPYILERGNHNEERCKNDEQPATALHQLTQRTLLFHPPWDRDWRSTLLRSRKVFIPCRGALPFPLPVCSSWQLPKARSAPFTALQLEDIRWRSVCTFWSFFSLTMYSMSPSRLHHAMFGSGCEQKFVVRTHSRNFVVAKQLLLPSFLECWNARIFFLTRRSNYLPPFVR